MRCRVAGLLLLTAVAACAGWVDPPAQETRWRDDWNARVDEAGEDRRAHPCGDYVFDRWADTFLSGCGPDPGAEAPACRQRLDWVWRRSRQCQGWQAWLLRNHNRQERRDDLPEPPTRVP